MIKSDKLYLIVVADGNEGEGGNRQNIMDVGNQIRQRLLDFQESISGQDFCPIQAVKMNRKVVVTNEDDGLSSVEIDDIDDVNDPNKYDEIVFDFEDTLNYPLKYCSCVLYEDTSSLGLPLEKIIGKSLQKEFLSVNFSIEFQLYRDDVNMLFLPTPRKLLDYSPELVFALFGNLILPESTSLYVAIRS